MKFAKFAALISIVFVTYSVRPGDCQELDAPPKAVKEEAGKPDRGQPTPDMGQQLLAGLKSIDGCLGVDSGGMDSGKSVIIAWFKDPDSVRRWFNHPVHAAMLRMVGTDPSEHEPLEHVTEDVPVMVIAAITFTDKPKIEGIPMPISQISIELFTPLPGGANINGRLAPQEFEVPEMEKY